MTSRELTELINNLEFKSIPGYETCYLMNKFGQVLSLKSRKILKPIRYTKDRYLYTLYLNGQACRKTVYDWYAITFGTIKYKKFFV